MDPTLIDNFIRFSIANSVWDVIATTYFNGNNTSQAQQRQVNGSLEKFFTELQGLWCEINLCLMECTTDITHYNNLLQEDQAYTVLNGLDDHFDNIYNDVI